ncbi:MAG: hypothetical protein DUD34_09375 [Lactobacillus sp.]|uniref:Uncharacterized protein n=1 Tax=Lentilactobacillus diolivorans TaxID=179838 RepID=A0ABQ0XC95_9LACO|nr:MAG: hypothetical protein DUD34_09375 [Lactobacillus sp.]GEP23698.1 hypothetical protein LDI01_12910 [Lentilactobacillus diolivorans]
MIPNKFQNTLKVTINENLFMFAFINGNNRGVPRKATTYKINKKFLFKFFIIIRADVYSGNVNFTKLLITSRKL